MENFADIFNAQKTQTRKIDIGSLIKGKVVDITKNSVILNAGLKSESMIPIGQFYDVNGKLEVDEGDWVEVAVESLEDGFGETVLSREQAKMIEAWRQLDEAYEQNKTVQGILRGRVKGGFSVLMFGVDAFLPGSLADIQPLHDFERLETKLLDFKIIKLDRVRNNVVVSRRAVLEEDSSSQRDNILEKLGSGDVIKGVVKNITDYGAFVGFDGFDGLLHITDMAWRRIQHPSELLTTGDEIEVKVLKLDKEKSRISLGLKQLTEDPWEQLAERYPKGSRRKGKVTSVTEYGCFVKIEDDIEGLVHISEMNWVGRNVVPSKIVSKGDEIEVMVLDIDKQKRRISLGIKQCIPNPWEEFIKNHPPKSQLKGKVKSINDFGLFIGLENYGIDGLVHLNDISNAELPERAIRRYKKGEVVNFSVLAVDVKRSRVSLSIKAVAGDPIGEYLNMHPKHSVVKGTVTEVNDNHVLVSLAKYVAGYFPRSEFDSEIKGGNTIADIKKGQEIEAKIVGVDRKNFRINLSIKKKEKDEEIKITKEYVSKKPVKTSLGDVFRGLFAGKVK